MTQLQLTVSSVTSRALGPTGDRCHCPAADRSWLTVSPHQRTICCSHIHSHSLSLSLSRSVTLLSRAVCLRFSRAPVSAMMAQCRDRPLRTSRTELLLRLIVAVCAAAYAVPLVFAEGQPAVTGLSSSSCSVGSDSSLYNCTVPLQVTVIGHSFCSLGSTDPLLGVCTVTVGNYSVGTGQVYEQSAEAVVFRQSAETVIFRLTSLSYYSALWWSVNTPLRYAAYIINIGWTQSTVNSTDSALGINIVLSPNIVSVTGCGIDVTSPATGLTNTSGCINGQSNVTVVTAVPLSLSTVYQVSLYTAASQAGRRALFSVLPDSSYTVSFQLPFIDWYLYPFGDVSLFVNIDQSGAALLYRAPSQVYLLYAPLDTPAFTALVSADCMPVSSPTGSSSSAPVNNTALTACGYGSEYTVNGSGMEPGYDIAAGSVPQSCAYVNSSAYHCTLMPRTAQLDSAAPLNITVLRRNNEIFTPGLSVALVGPLVLTCVTGCASSVNCTAQGCLPGDVVSVSGTGWLRSTSCTTLSTGSFSTVLTGCVDYSTRLINFVIPSWYTLRYTPDEPYSLSLSLGGHISTLPNSLSFNYPPTPAVWSVSGCSVQLGNRTSNCTLPSQEQPLELTVTGQNLYYQSLFVYLAGIYCPGDYFYNAVHYNDQPTASLRIKCYQALFPTDTWLSLAITLSDTPFDTVVVPQAVWFTAPATNATSAETTITIRTGSSDLLYLLFLLIFPVTIVLVTVVCLRQLQPYRAALLLLARMRSSQKEAAADDKPASEESRSTQSDTFEMVSTAPRSLAYQPPPQLLSDDAEVSDGQLDVEHAVARMQPLM